MKHMTTILALLIGMLVISNVNANPQERAQITKGFVVQRASLDGWNLVNESPSLLVFERQSGFGQTFLMHMMTGANGTWAVERMTVTIIPNSDHLTGFQCVMSISSQNAFGQTTSVPIRNGRTQAYQQSIADYVAARMPAKYRTIKPQ
jgi:hypothetical protein